MPLYVSVDPSLTVTDTTVMDAAAFNQLGTPVVSITGTLDGSSALSVGAGTVTNAMLENMPANTVKGRDEAEGVPVNLTMHSSMDIASGALKVADGGITTTQLASAATTADGAIADVNIATGIIGSNKLKAQAALTLLGNAGDTASAAPDPIRIYTGLSVINQDEIATTNRSRTSNVATITTASSHSVVAGSKVNITGVSGTGYNAYGVTALTGTTGSTIKYASVGDDEASTSDTGGKARLIESSGASTSYLYAPSFFKAFCVFNGGVSSGGVNLNALTYTYSASSPTVVVTSSSAHGLATGEMVRVTSATGVLPVGSYIVTFLSTTTFSITASVTGSGTAVLGPFVYGNGAYNVTSVTRNGTGDYTIALTNAITPTPSLATGTLLCTQITTNCKTAGNRAITGVLYGIGTEWQTATTIRIQTGGTFDGVAQDLNSICVSVFGNPTALLI